MVHLCPTRQQGASLVLSQAGVKEAHTAAVGQAVRHRRPLQLARLALRPVLVSLVAACIWALPGGAFTAPTRQPSLSHWLGGARGAAGSLAGSHLQHLERGQEATAASIIGGVTLTALAVSLVRRARGDSASSSKPASSLAARKPHNLCPGPSRIALKAWPWEDDDPYSRCSAVKLQVGLQFSKPLLAQLNKLAETGDTESDEGLHQLMLDVVLALRRAEASWRYGAVERVLASSEDDGREATAALQRWGIEAQSKWGDGEDWEKMDKNATAGMTEYLIVTLMASCYGTLCPEDKELKVRGRPDVKKILDAISSIQVDELMQVDVQWIPEEDGDSLSAMEVTMKFPELAIL